MDRLRIGLVVAAVVALAVIPVWVWAIAPELTVIPDNFRYQARLVSFDNFFDPSRGQFKGPARSNTRFSYDVVARDGNKLLIRNIFDVRQASGEKIFAVERAYGIDRKSGKHIPDYGDRPRSGYLFAAKGAPKKSFTYWHINYDNPARMKLVREEEIDGLAIDHYRSLYHADQTDDLGHLPGVPEKRGVRLNIRLDTWIEPTTGYLVKYEDHTLAYYYSRQSGKRIYPWNSFRNRYSQASISDHIEEAKHKKKRARTVERLVPLALAFLAVVLIALAVLAGRFRRTS